MCVDSARLRSVEGIEGVEDIEGVEGVEDIESVEGIECINSAHLRRALRGRQGHASEVHR